MRRLPGVYYAATWGEPVGDSTTGARIAELWAYVKDHQPSSPFLVANEYAAHRIGTQLGLPLPPGGLVGDGRTLGFASLSFRKGGASSPPVIPEQLVADDERLAAGVVVLDVMILNTDRHKGNLAYGGQTQRLEVFDHSHALFGHYDTPEQGRRHLEGLANHLVVDGDLRGRRVEPHCLMHHLLDALYLMEWCHEARSVLTDRFLGALCDELVESRLLPSRDLGRLLHEVLVLRRQTLRDIIRDNEPRFLGTDPKSWSLT